MENNFKFYNTLTRQIDTVVPRVDGKIGMYTCGPTVYQFCTYRKYPLIHHGGCAREGTSLCGL